MGGVLAGREGLGLALGTALWAVAVLCRVAPVEAASVGVAGTIRYHGSELPVASTEVVLEGTAPAAETDLWGQYALTATTGTSAEIAPRKLGDVGSAISAADAVAVLQAVVGLRTLDPMEQLACDVSGDGRMSAVDAVLILQYRVGLLDRFPAAVACASDWLFMPEPAASANQEITPPDPGSDVCQLGGIRWDPLVGPADDQDFSAVLIGDCTGNWQPALLPPTASPTPSHTRTQTATPSRTPSSTQTPTITRTSTPTSTPTRTPTPTRTLTATWSPSSTRTLTPTKTPTVTRTPTITKTPTATPTLSPTPTATCANGVLWNLTDPTPLMVHDGGEIWLTKSVPTDFGWGIFWLRVEPDSTQTVRLYYAHVGFDGAITTAPVVLHDIPRLPFRGRYYLVAWHEDHFGLLLAAGSTLYYFNLSLDGVLSGQRVVGPVLFNSTVYGQEADGDCDSYADGFICVIEGECVGHLCSYAFRLAPDGTPTTANYNIVDFDYTHQVFPRVAYDGSGFAILSVKDINILNGGVGTKYWRTTGIPSTGAKVVPTKEYLWDELPDIAWNGDHFAALWTENTGRDWATPWQVHFASFFRTYTSAALIADQVLDTQFPKSPWRWVTQVHPLGADWLVQYTHGQPDADPVATYEVLSDQGEVLASLTPFTMNADALGSSVHYLDDAGGKISIVRGVYEGSGATIELRFLDPPRCAP